MTEKQKTTDQRRTSDAPKTRRSSNEKDEWKDLCNRDIF